jgi:hypothetical protein
MDLTKKHRIIAEIGDNDYVLSKIATAESEIKRISYEVQVLAQKNSQILFLQ